MQQAVFLAMKVIACTPTKDRRWSWEFSKSCMSAQKMKPDAWVIVDNSSTPAYDWSVAKSYPGVVYERIYEPKTISEQRNRCLEIALREGADYIVFWDDDDYYPPTRISVGVEALAKNPESDIAGSSLMYLLLTRENVLMTTGPFNKDHATAATWTIRRSYAEKNRFNPIRLKGEERDFTNEWTAKMLQVSAEDMIVVMGHGRNTVDKSDLLKRPNVYLAKFVNSDNGKMVFRSRWTVQWDIWKATFVDGVYSPPPECNQLAVSQSVEVPSLHTEETGASAECRA